mgnify:CR=1 FL=1
MNEIKEENLRSSMFNRMHLTPKNEKIAHAYLDMENEENIALLSDIQQQDLTDVFPINGYAEYLKWLRKNKRVEELSRYVRFVVELGGSTAWCILTNDNNDATLSDAESMLIYLTGEHAEEQKMAVRAALCAWQLYKEKNVEDTKTLLLLCKENPELLLHALKYCHKVEKSRQHGRHHARMLLTAIYLYWTKAETAPQLTNQLLVDLIGDIPIIVSPAKAYLEREVQCLQNYVQTAGKDTPFPQNVLSICQERKGWMQVTFHAACTFLALRHSVQFELLFRLMLAHGSSFKTNIEALDTARAIVEDTVFHETMEQIEDMLPILDEDYIIWCLYGNPTAAGKKEKVFINCTHAECEAEIQRMAVKNPDSIRAAVKKADSEEYKKLTMLVQTVQPALYNEIHASYQEVFCAKLVSELQQYWQNEPCKEITKQYFLGKYNFDTFIAKLKQQDQQLSNFLSERKYERVNNLKTIGEYQFCRRVLIVALLKGSIGFFIHYPASEDRFAYSNDSLLYDKEQIAGIFQLFEKENISVCFQLIALGNVYESRPDKKEKFLFLTVYTAAAIEQMQKNKDQWEEGIAQALVQNMEGANCICCKILAQCESLDRFKEQMFEIIKNATEQVQKLLVDIFEKHQEWEADILALLKSKNLKERNFAIMVLEEWTNSAHLELVKETFTQEKNKKLAARLQDLICDLESAVTEENQLKLYCREEEKLAAKIYKGVRRRKVEWVKTIHFPTVHFQNIASENSTPESEKDILNEGLVASPEYLLAILVSYAHMDVLGISEEAKILTSPLVPQELAAYIHALYSGWIAAGAEAKTRWVLYAAAIHADAEMLSLMQKQLKDWAEHSRGAIAADAVRAIAFNGSAQALLLVDQIARKFKSNQVKNAAKEALNDAAIALGISREELDDRIIPNLGLNMQAERILDYGARTFTVRLTPQLTLEIYDNSNKQLKKLPSPGKQDDAEKAAWAQEELKQMKKQLKLVITAQKLRLDQILTTARFWKAQSWKELFVNNPVMRQFAVDLIWGLYENGQLKDTFRYMEDGSFNTVDEAEYTFPETGMIGLVHPLELSEELLQAWKEQLSDYEITQPIEQLDRPVYYVTEEEKGIEKITRFYGKTINGAAFVGKLLSVGWVRGEILDGGFFDNCYRSDSEFGAELTFSGCSVGYGNEEVIIDDLVFTKVVHGASYGEETCTPDKVSERYFSEIILQITRIVG